MNSLASSGMHAMKIAKMQSLLNENKNGSCADCGMALSIDTAWAVLSYGIFVCEDCKLVHIEQENHYKALDQQSNSENSITGILPTSLAQHWNEKDVEQMKANGNEKVNKKLLSNIPAWQYRPTAHDGIKHKEYWINYKYSKMFVEGEEIPKTAGKSFIGIQFTRPMPKGHFPCCAVLQNDKLYLTSDMQNEEVHVENIETILLNSKRIGRENGVQLTYRTARSGEAAQDGVTYTYLQHDNMETVLDWINLVLYTKYNLLKKKYQNCSRMDISKMLNCAVIKESYMSAAGHGLVYVSLSEARIACFQHHLDEKPLFHLPITKAMNFTGSQYLDAVAQFFNMDVSKIYGYEEWNKSLDYVINLDKLEYIAEELVKPVNSLRLLRTSEPIATPNLADEKEPVVNDDGGAAQQPPVVTESASPPPKAELVNNDGPAAAAFKDGRPGNNSGEEKSAKKYECYPPIGPMGEMGKVARGELPPEAIKPPPPKADLARAQLYNIMTSANSAITMPSSMQSMLAPQSVGNFSHSIGQQPAVHSNQECYPPISGPMREMVKSTDIFHSQPRLSRDDSYPVIDEFKPMNAVASGAFRNQERAYGTKAHMSGVNSYAESDMSQYSRMALNNGWMGSPDNLLTVPWKQTRNGYEPARVFGQSSTLDSWNEAKHAGSLDQWQMKQSPDMYFGIANALLPRGSQVGGTQEHVIMENLHQQWTSAERKLLALIHNGYVPASNMTAAGLDADSADHAQTCISELFDLLWKKRYDLALSFLRGFREVFSRSANPEIRNRFIGVGELDTMKQIFLQQGREKFVKADSGRVTWKQPSPSPTNLDHTWQNSANQAAHQEPSIDFTPWGPLSPNLATPSSVGLPNVWGSAQVAHAARTPSASCDPWNVMSEALSPTETSIATNGSQPFNRAPSRPISLARSSFSENSQTEGSFGSKASSKSASPGVITPPPSFDTCMTSAALTGIETTLKNLFLNSNASGSTLWN